MHAKHPVSIAMVVAFFITATGGRELQAQDAPDYAPESDRLNLSEPCADGGTLQESRCLQAQGDKADRWLKSIFESYHADIGDLSDRIKKEGFTPDKGYDPVGHLLRSETQFETYRKTMTDFAWDVAFPGSIAGIEAPSLYFKLTVDRAEELLQSCGFKGKIPDVIDLTFADWCQQEE